MIELLKELKMILNGCGQNYSLGAYFYGIISKKRKYCFIYPSNRRESLFWNPSIL